MLEVWRYVSRAPLHDVVAGQVQVIPFMVSPTGGQKLCQPVG